MKTISPYFEEIKTLFKTGITKIGLLFDEDVFSNTIEQCNKNIQEELSKEEIMRYFWIAFRNNTFRELQYVRNKVSDEILEDVIDEENCLIDDNFDEVSALIVNKFGEKLYQLFALHADGKPYKELYKLTTISNLKYKFRCIRDYIRSYYKKEGEE